MMIFEKEIWGRYAFPKPEIKLKSKSLLATDSGQWKCDWWMKGHTFRVNRIRIDENALKIFFLRGATHVAARLYTSYYSGEVFDNFHRGVCTKTRKFRGNGRLIANRAHFFVQVLCVKICTVGMNQLLTFALIVIVKNLFCFSSLIPDIEFLV